MARVVFASFSVDIFRVDIFRRNVRKHFADANAKFLFSYAVIVRIGFSVGIHRCHKLLTIRRTWGKITQFA